MTLRARFLAAWVPTLLGLATHAWAGSPWLGEVVEDVEEFELADTGLQLDAQSRPHIFVGGDAVYHRWFDGASWQREVIDPTPRSGENLFAAIGPAGEFHVLYERFSLGRASDLHVHFITHEIHYATNASGTWQVQAVPPPDVGLNIAEGAVRGIAVDPTGALHALIFVEGRLYHARYGSGAWSFERVDDANTGGAGGATFPSSHSRLAADSTGRLHAVWLTSPVGLVYSLRDATGWHHERLEQVGDEAIDPEGDEMTIVIESDGRPNVVVVEKDDRPFASRQLMVLRRETVGWSGERVTSWPWAFSVAAGPAGRLDISWQPLQVGSEPPGVGHARRQGTTWTVDEASEAGSSDIEMSMRVDASGRALLAILYPSWPYHDRRLALLQSDVGSGWTDDVIAYSAPVWLTLGRPSSESLFGADVRIGSVGAQRRLLYRSGDGLGGNLRRAAETAGGFAIEAVSNGTLPAGSNPRGFTQLVTGAGTEYALWTDQRVRLGTRSGAGSWTFAEIWGASLEGSVNDSARPELALDGAGALHVLFSFEDANDLLWLQRGSNASGSWQFTPIAQLGPNALALAVEPGGAEHVAYIDGDGRVMYATNHSGVWQHALVGQLPFDWYFGTLDLHVQTDGTVDVVFERYQSGILPFSLVPTGLAFASNRCAGAFRTQEIDPLIDVEVDPFGIPYFYGSRNPELVLDSGGNPHVSYQRLADRSLEYARVVDRNWVLEAVATSTYSGESSAIAVDAGGTISIAHHDPWGGNLSLATRAPLSAETVWDGCPGLPGPSVPLDGDFVFETPPGALPLYDPSGVVTTTLGGVELGWFRTIGNNGTFRVEQAFADLEGGGEELELRGIGKGKLKGKKGVVQLSESAKLHSSVFPPPNKDKLKVVRTEVANLATRTRVVSQKLRGSVGGEKMRVDSVVSEPIPGEELGIRLKLSIAASSGSALTVTGSWETRGAVPLWLVGTGTWSAADESADLVLKNEFAPRIEIVLSGVRAHHAEGADVYLSAESASVRGLGQTVSADLAGAFEATAPEAARAGAPSAR